MAYKAKKDNVVLFAQRYRKGDKINRRINETVARRLIKQGLIEEEKKQGKAKEEKKSPQATTKEEKPKAQTKGASGTEQSGENQSNQNAE